MFIAVRKEQNGSIYIDKNIFSKTKEIVDEQGNIEVVPLFKDEELSNAPYNYTKIEIGDEYIDCVPSDFNNDLQFSVESYNIRKNIEKKQELRALREPLLIAFDKYKSNVNYGVEFEDEKQRNIIIKWYNEIKNLNENYIIKDENIPERIKYYL